MTARRKGCRNGWMHTGGGMRISFLSSAAALWLAFCAAAAGADCVAPDPAPDPAFATVSMAAQGHSGDTLRLAWADPWPEAAGCEGRRFLVLALPAATRVAGAGALVLAPGEAGPHGIGWGNDRLRLFVPVDDPDLARGAVDLSPYLIGPYAADWALVEVSSAGRERVAAMGALNATIAPGRPWLVVEDPADTETPRTVTQSPGGAFALEVLATRFRVRDRQTGTVVLTGEGIAPGFSPTGRFLHVFRSELPPGAEDADWLHADLQVFDLLTGTEAFAIRRGGQASRGDFITGLLWSPADSYLAVMGEANGGLMLKAMLTDAPAQGGKYDCGACWPWGGGRIVIDALAGHVDTGGGHDGERRSLYLPHQTMPYPDSLLGQEPEVLVLDMLGPPRASWLAKGVAGQPGVPDLVQGRSGETVEAEAAAQLAATEVSTRAAVPLEAGEDSRLAYPAQARMQARLADMGLVARPLLSLTRQRIPNEFVRALDALPEDADMPELDEWLIEGGYYFDTGRAALDAGLVDADQARRLAETALGAMQSGLCLVSRANEADLWTYRSTDGSLTQLLHIRCRASTDYMPEGALYLIRLAPGGAARLTEVAAHGSWQEDESWDMSPVDGQPASAVPMDGLVPLAVHGALSVWRVAPEVLAVAGIDGTAVLLDARDGTLTRVQRDLPAPDRLLRLGLTETGGHLLQEQVDGRFHVFAALDGAPLLDGVYLDDEVVVTDPALRFDATAEGAGFLAARFPGDPWPYSLDQLGARLQVAGLVAEVLASGRPASSAAPLDALPPRLVAETGAGGAGLLPDDWPQAVAVQAPGGLAAVEVFRDGVAVARLAAGGDDGLRLEAATLAGLLAGAPVAGSSRATGPLPPETRWLSFRAEDRAGLTSRVLSLALPPADPATDAGAPVGRLHVLAVGIDRFDDPRLPDLSYAGHDASRLAAALAAAPQDGRYAGVTVEIIDPAADLRSVLPSRLAALQGLTPEDTVILFIATHGVLDPEARFYLAQGSTRLDALAATAVDIGVIATALERVPARGFVFLDACHSGAAAQGTNDAALAGLKARASRWAVIAASKGRQPSLEAARLGGGAFTSGVIRAITDPATDRDGDGALDLWELHAAVKRDVVLATGGRQTPWIARSGFVGPVPLLQAAVP